MQPQLRTSPHIVPSPTTPPQHSSSACSFLEAISVVCNETRIPFGSGGSVLVEFFFFLVTVHYTSIHFHGAPE